MGKWVICLICVCLFACHSKRLVNEFQAIPHHVWEYDKPVVFEVDMQDSTKDFEAKINLRYNSAYLLPYLGLIVTIQDPQGQIERREVVFYLQDEKGNFKGEVAGDIWDYCCFTLIEPRRFQPGKYRFSLYQVTAMPAIRDVMGIGLEVHAVQ